MVYRATAQALNDGPEYPKIKWELYMRSDTLETKRLLLRPFHTQDVDRFAQICANPNVMRYIGNGTPESRTIVTSKIKTWIELYEQQGYGLMALVMKETNELIGFCGLMYQVVDEEACVELGYRLDEPYWGRGIATEAAVAVKNHAFNQLNIPMLISIIHHENINSKRVAHKVGMKLMKMTSFKDKPVDIFCIHNPLQPE